MPSYPASVKTFTNKASGQNIDPAHVNDIQDEVNAMEAGLLNGTARVNSSGSTVTTLSVTGASTFSVRPVAPPPDAAVVFLASTYAAGSSANSTLSWLSESVLTNSSMHSTTTNPDRLTPQSTGLYHCSAQILTGGAPAAASQIRLFIRDSTGDNIAVQDEGGLSAAQAYLGCAGYKRFDVLGGFGLVVFNNVAGASTFSLSSGAGVSMFSMVKL